MPVWMAGTQVRKDASEDIHVNLIPALHAGMTNRGVLLKVTEAPPPRIFKEAHEEHEGLGNYYISNFLPSCSSRPRGDNVCFDFLRLRRAVLNRDNLTWRAGGRRL